MVASVPTARVRCTVICLEPVQDRIRGREALRPSELLPWADPYIAGLVRGLQDEVRRQRAGTPWSAATAVRAEIDPPSPAHDAEWTWEWREQPRWGGDASTDERGR